MQDNNNNNTIVDNTIVDNTNISLTPVVEQADNTESKSNPKTLVLKNFNVIINGKNYTFFGDEEKLELFKENLKSEFGMTTTTENDNKNESFIINPKDGKEVDISKIKELSKDESISHYSTDEKGDIEFVNNTNVTVFLVCMDANGNVIGELNPETGDFKYSEGDKEKAEAALTLLGIKSIGGKPITLTETTESLSKKYENMPRAFPIPYSQAQQPINQAQQPIDQVQQSIDQAQQPIDQVQQPIDQVQQPIDQVQQPINQEEEENKNNNLSSIKSISQTQDVSKAPNVSNVSKVSNTQGVGRVQ